MFGRWSQENFLKYMREHYALDRLLSYQVLKMDETTQVVNPVWRKLDRAVRSLTAKLHPRLARFGAMNLAGPIDPEAVESFLKKKAAVQQEIQALQTQLRERKVERAAVDQHLPLGQVPEAERFDRLSSGSKDLVDTIKLVAYQAETAMAHVLREGLPKWRQEEERRLLQSLYASEADLIPDPVAGTLTVRIHYPANALLGRAVATLCEELTTTETVFPTTHLRLVYQLADGAPAGRTGLTAFDAESKRMLTHSEDALISVGDLADPTQRISSWSYRQQLAELGFSEDGRCVYAASLETNEQGLDGARVGDEATGVQAAAPSDARAMIWAPTLGTT
jgi:hypothetical protein